jgi:wobble nucleotide-excising tRNase
MCYETHKQAQCCYKRQNCFPEGKYFSKKKKIEALEHYAKELEEKANDIKEYIKELSPAS